MMTKEVYTGNEILDLIPQRKPIVMLDRFECNGPDSCSSSLTLTPDNLFLRSGNIMDVGIIEHIAQTAAALSGWTAAKAGDPVRLGYIGEVSRLKTADIIPVAGDRLDSILEVAARAGDVTLVKAESRIGETVVLNCRLKISIDRATRPRLKVRSHFKVPFFDVDAVRMLWHGNYIKYMEIGREDFGRRYDLPYLGFVDHGYVVPVKEVRMNYLESARYDDSLTLETEYVPKRGARLDYAYRLYRDSDGKLLFEASTVQLFTTIKGALEIAEPEFYTQWKNKWEQNNA